METQTTSSSRTTKRLRAELKDDESLLSATSSKIFTKVLAAGTNDQEYRLSVRSKGKKTSLPTHSDLVNLMCPPFKLKFNVYGNALQNLTNSGSNRVFQTAKAMASVRGAQQVYSFFHMPVINPTVGGTGIYMSTQSLSTLIDKGKDVQNLQPNTANSIPLNTDQGYSPVRGYDQAFVFHGGYIKHTFVNTCNMDIKMTVALSKPKRAIYWDGQFGTSLQDSLLPITCALKDKKMNAPLRANHLPTQDPFMIDSCTDLTFNYSPSDRLLHTNYKVVQKQITVQPGGKVTVTVNLPPFKFMESTWNQLVANQQSSSITQATYPATFAPFCTQILDVFIKGQLVHSEDYTQVGISETSMIHTQEEYYHCRAVPFVPFNTVVYYDAINGVQPEQQVHINEEDETEDTIIN